jgi:DNA-binding PadR family transcriptional regulator
MSTTAFMSSRIVPELLRARGRSESSDIDPHAEYNNIVGTAVTTRVALLQALRDGPGYGRGLIDRVKRITEGALRLSPARVYPSLQRLEKEGLVLSRCVSPKGARGARSRRYYELTPEGVFQSTKEREVLAALLRRGPAAPPSPSERIRMAQRVLDAEELADTGSALRSAMLASESR